MLGLRRVGEAARELAPTNGLSGQALWEQSASIQMADAHFPTTDGRKLVFQRYTQPEKDQPILRAQRGRGVAGTTAAADHGPRRRGRAAGLSHELVWVQAFGEARLIGSRLR